MGRDNFFVLSPLLFEACAGALELRHCAQPIRPALGRARFAYGATPAEAEHDAWTVVMRLHPRSGDHGLIGGPCDGAPLRSWPHPHDTYEVYGSGGGGRRSRVQAQDRGQWASAGGEPLPAGFEPLGRYRLDARAVANRW